MSVTLGGSSKLKWTGASPISAYPFSLFCWVKFATTSAIQVLMGVGKDGNTADGEGTIFAYGSAGQKVLCNMKVSGGAQYASSVLDMDTAWQPALAVFESATSRRIFYGASATAGTDSVSITPIFANWDEIIIGERPAEDGSFYLNADIAEAALWSADMSAHWATLQGGALPEGVNGGANLVEHWSLETAGSYTGTVSRTLTATGTPTQAATHPISRGGGSAAGAAAHYYRQMA